MISPALTNKSRELLRSTRYIARFAKDRKRGPDYVFTKEQLTRSIKHMRIHILRMKALVDRAKLRRDSLPIDDYDSFKPMR
jgi:hypothetical protein